MNRKLETLPAADSILQKLTRLLAAPTVEPSQRAMRIQTVEKDIVLPIKILLIIILVCYFWHWSDDPKSPHGIALNYIRWFFEFYVAFNIAAAIVFLSRRQLGLRTLQWLMFAIGLTDGLLLGAIPVLDRGFDSNVYWVFPALILHNALAIPVAIPQLLLNVFVSFCFLIGGLADQKILSLQLAIDKLNPLFQPNPDDNRIENPIERLIVLLLWAACCYGIQTLFEKQKRAEAEATEFAVRQERLHTAGRLAAEIAHQIKNPLGIITNAAFCLQRSVREGQTSVDEQIGIIREEVERADQIITELMGYAQLAEGKVERLEVADEIDNAILQVFPPAAKYSVEVHKDCDPNLPALLMQKRHFSGVLVNLMQNAREAMHGCGRIDISARIGANDSIVVVINDNGPGIAPDKIDKIFDAYFTTRAKGTGLGLAIVKHNTEMYGGNVQVQSELGKGTRFTLEFPPRILMKLTLSK